MGLSAFLPRVSVAGATIRATINAWGETMRHATVLLATLLLAGTAAGCSSKAEDKADAKPRATATVTATPSLSQTEIKRLCTVAISEAAPSWDDWNFDPGKWSDDPRTPEVCQGLKDEEFPPRGNREFMSALLDGLDLADDPRASQ